MRGFLSHMVNRWTLIPAVIAAVLGVILGMSVHGASSTVHVDATVDTPIPYCANMAVPLQVREQQQAFFQRFDFATSVDPSDAIVQIPQPKGSAYKTLSIYWDAASCTFAYDGTDPAYQGLADIASTPNGTEVQQDTVMCPPASMK